MVPSYAPLYPLKTFGVCRRYKGELFPETGKRDSLDFGECALTKPSDTENFNDG